MKQKLKVTILLATLIVSIIGTSTVALAGELFSNKNVSTSWTTIASDTEGFNCNVELIGRLTTLGAKIHVRMLGKTGNVLWTERNSMGGLSSRVYRCGADVYKIQVSVNSGVKGSVSAQKTTKQPN